MQNFRQNQKPASRCKQDTANLKPVEVLTYGFSSVDKLLISASSTWVDPKDKGLLGSLVRVLDSRDNPGKLPHAGFAGCAGFGIPG